MKMSGKFAESFQLFWIGGKLSFPLAASVEFREANELVSFVVVVGNLFCGLLWKSFLSYEQLNEKSMGAHSTGINKNNCKRVQKGIQFHFHEAQAKIVEVSLIEMNTESPHACSSFPAENQHTWL
jgi:hypothetical protein